MRHCWLLFLMACLCAGCSRPASGPLAGCGNGVYYWRTTFSLDSTERVFLRQHHIDRIFCRYFDVVLNDQGEPMPNATLTFDAKMPDSIEIVPTVFVMENCMREPYIDSLASRLVRRVLQMNETNDISTTGELQIDCDYTARSRQTFYHFLERVKAELAARLSPVSSQLSVTIRLHQLSMPAPPADYGVLMLYNTGAPERFAERNPILDMRDVKPYLKHLKDYPLPLAAAYPVFRWQRTLHGVSIDHVAQYDEILQAKQAVEAERDDVRRHIVTYHLDKENIQRYQPEQYEAIYRH